MIRCEGMILSGAYLVSWKTRALLGDDNAHIGINFCSRITKSREYDQVLPFVKGGPAASHANTKKLHHTESPSRPIGLISLMNMQSQLAFPAQTPNKTAVSGPDEINMLLLQRR